MAVVTVALCDCRRASVARARAAQDGPRGGVRPEAGVRTCQSAGYEDRYHNDEPFGVQRNRLRRNVERTERRQRRQGPQQSRAGLLWFRNLHEYATTGAVASGELPFVVQFCSPAWLPTQYRPEDLYKQLLGLFCKVDEAGKLVFKREDLYDLLALIPHPRAAERGAGAD